MFPRVIKLAVANLLPRSVYLPAYARIATWSIATKRRYAPEIDLLPRFVHSGDTVLDVGAGHGLYTYHLSRLVGPAGTVHAFEPIPLNVRILSHAVRSQALRNVVIHAQGCGEKPQRATFGVSLEHGIPQLGDPRQAPEGLQFDCEIVKLDDVIHSKVQFIKVDVEGAELFVFRGAERIIRQCQPVILFEAGQHTGAFGYEQQAVFDFLSGLNYKFFSGGWVGKKPLEPRDCFTDAEDYFAVSVDAAPALA